MGIWARFWDFVNAGLDGYREFYNEKIQPIFDIINSGWKYLLAIWRPLRPFTPIAIIIIFSAILMLEIPQGRDVVANIEYAPPSKRWFFLFAILFNGWAAWFFGRQISSFIVVEMLKPTNDSNKDVRNLPGWIRWVAFYFPVILGSVPFIAAISAIVLAVQVSAVSGEKGFVVTLGNIALYVQSAFRNSTFIIACLFFLVFLAFMVLYQPGHRSFKSWRMARTQSGAVRAHSDRDDRQKNRIISTVGGVIIISFLVTFVYYCMPLVAPQFLGPAATAFMATGFFISFSGGLALWLFKSRFPIYWVLALLYLFTSSRWGLGDNAHIVRSIDTHAQKQWVASDRYVGPKDRLDIQSAVCLWADINLQHKLAPELAPAGDVIDLPMVFVSVEGGASRAGYWASTVLSALEHDSSGEFHNAVFSISAVSGGALGATSYSASLKSLNYPTSKEALLGFAKQMAHFNGQDYLSPAIAGMLYYDPIQDFIPWWNWGDRSKGLETAFEYGWKKSWETHYPNAERPDVGYRSPFLMLSPRAGDQHWTPMLTLVGTHQQSGKRILTSHSAIPPNVDALDFYHLARQDIYTSTAVMNSARFPLVSPPGWIVRNDEDGRKTYGHIIDGGYFEGGGVDTMVDVYESTIDAFQRVKAKHSRWKADPENKDNGMTDTCLELWKTWEHSLQAVKLKPMFLEITNNDEGLRTDSIRFISGNTETCNLNRLPKVLDVGFHTDEKCGIDENTLPTVTSPHTKSVLYNEFTGPLQGLFSTRGARGIRAAKSLSNLYENPRPIILPARQTERPKNDVIKPKFYAFRLCKTKLADFADSKAIPTAMSWGLSEVSKAGMDMVFFNAPFNTPKHIQHKDGKQYWNLDVGQPEANKPLRWEKRGDACAQNNQIMLSRVIDDVLNRQTPRQE